MGIPQVDIQQAQQELRSRLLTLYDGREASHIADWVMEHLTGLKKIDRLLQKNAPLTGQALSLLQQYTTELLVHRPVQYVLHESWFCGLKFYVEEGVLIPRPETEELVEWAVKLSATPPPEYGHAGHAGSKPDSPSPTGSSLAPAPAETPPAPPVILDMGTGSGCIAISLKKKLPRADVYACDISEKALAIARRNAADNGTDIQFQTVDFLASAQWETLPPINWLISNPPYIPLKDEDGMALHVTRYEPHGALFVEDHDPFIFYQALADFARQKLLPGGGILVEIHEELAGGVQKVFQKAGFQQIILKKDMSGKDRMILATQMSL